MDQRERDAIIGKAASPQEKTEFVHPLHLLELFFSLVYHRFFLLFSFLLRHLKERKKEQKIKTSKVLSVLLLIPRASCLVVKPLEVLWALICGLVGFGPSSVGWLWKCFGLDNYFRSWLRMTANSARQSQYETLCYQATVRHRTIDIVSHCPRHRFILSRRVLCVLSSLSLSDDSLSFITRDST